MPVFFGLLSNMEKENILQTITKLLQYMVLEIQLWPVKCKNVTVRYAKILSNISFFLFQATPAIAMDGLDENNFKMLLNVFSTAFTYSNFIVCRLFYFCKIN